MIELELEERGNMDQIIGAIDRSISGGAPFATIMAGALNGILGQLFTGAQRRAAGPHPHSSPQQPRSRHAGMPPPPRPNPPPNHPPPRSPAPDPHAKAHEARELLGFGPTEPLTKEKVNKRKQGLARVFHPDMAGGSEAHMKRVNAAADLLLSKLP